MSRVKAGKPFVDADSEFHALIATAAHNVLLSFSMLPTMSLLEDVRVKIVKQKDSIAASQAEHERILAAIGALDGGAAEQAMRDHINWFQDRGSAVARRTAR